MLFNLRKSVDKQETDAIYGKEEGTYWEWFSIKFLFYFGAVWSSYIEVDALAVIIGRYIGLGLLYRWPEFSNVFVSRAYESNSFQTDKRVDYN